MKKSKALLLTVCAIVLVAASVLGTIAYLTSQETVVNTFTVGQVKIIVDEAKITPDGTPVLAERVKENNYHLVPGKTYMKDPTMTVVKGSEESYLRMLVTVNCMEELDAAFAPTGADLTSIFGGYNASDWIYEATVRDANSNTITYEFRYKETVKPNADSDLTLSALFTSLSVPATFDGEDMASIAGLEITVVGHAIQAVGFDNADEAWTAFDGQVIP